ncbi:hypothetical protein [Sphingomonas sp. 22176]|uniref:hypothetical protein n=1 Tax=Sphingomonas sp. 22176 TaxID=3453884 RepID=UPI003F84CBE1
MMWLKPWVARDDFGWSEEEISDFCTAWEQQLVREVGPQHILRGLVPTLIARRFDCDDALFRLPDGRIAEVHLTWRESEEPDPRWPSTGIFSSLEKWTTERMAKQHQALIG